MAKIQSFVLLIATFGFPLVAIGERSIENSTAIPATLFGMHLAEPVNPCIPFGALAKGTFVVWPWTEPSRGNFHWERLDQYVSFGRERGVSFIYSFEHVPEWAVADKETCKVPFKGAPAYCTGMVREIKDWDSYVTALVTRYKGRIPIYELWNEPDHYFTGDMDDFVTLTKHAHDIIRRVDPRATIVSPPPSAGAPGIRFMDKYWAADGIRDVDVVSFHAYPDDRTRPEQVRGMSESMKSVMAKHRLSNKLLWDTEGSWGDTRKQSIAGPHLQSAFVARYFLLHWSFGITRLYWYSWDNERFGTLWDKEDGPHPAAVAYQEVYKWMMGATMTEPCEEREATWTCGFTRPGGYRAQAVWNTEGRAEFKPDGHFMQFRTLTGETEKIKGRVTVDREPILLESGEPPIKSESKFRDGCYSEELRER
jgi:Glycosyl hydrolases family 39